ncbi:MAG: peptide deformylase [Patescibacteria group bacterium UBA2163]
MEKEIVFEGDPVLRAIAKEVPRDLFGSKKLYDIIANMQRALRNTEYGVAIAAPQIGVSYRIFLVRGFVMQNNEKNDEDEDVVFINPTIVRTSKATIEIDGEGCLSVPHIYGTVVRHEKVAVQAYDAQGKKFERGGSGLIAEIYEHEIEHLDGILFIDKAVNLREEIKKPTDNDEEEDNESTLKTHE